MENTLPVLYMAYQLVKCSYHKTVLMTSLPAVSQTVLKFSLSGCFSVETFIKDFDSHTQHLVCPPVHVTDQHRAVLMLLD